MRVSRRKAVRFLGGAATLLISAACSVNPPAPAPASKINPTVTPAPARVVSSPATASSPSAAVRPVAKPPDFPTRPLEIIVPFNPGGGYDSVARQLIIPLQTALGQPVLIKNVPGGGQRIAARQFQQSPADGYTLLYSSDTTLWTDVMITPADGFDLRSWIWLAGVRKSPAFVAVAGDSRWASLSDVLDADARGRRIRMGHNGVGGYLPTQVALVSALGMKSVAFVGGFTGTSDIAPALVRGELDLQVFSPISSTLQFVRSGELRALVTLEPARSELLPEIPTARELSLPGVADLEIAGTAHSGIAVPPGTPTARADYLGAMILTALRDAGFQRWAHDTGVEPDIQEVPGPRFTEIKRIEYEVWKRYETPMRLALS